MKKHDYIPHSDHDFLIWFENFISNLTPELGLPESLVSDLKSHCAGFRTLAVSVAGSQATTKQIIRDKNDMQQSSVALIRAATHLIKARLDYTDGEGAKLGIDGQIDTFNLEMAKPDLSAVDKTGGIVFLSFTKNKSHGINLYEKRGNAADWVFLGRVTSSPYKDNRSLLQAGVPELRRYTAVYMLNDEEIGEFSDEIVVNCAP